jgi:predicted transcriptional regulator of viral defense system
VILDLEWRGQRTVSLQDLRSGPGLFQLIPADRGPDAVADTNPLAAGAWLVRPHFFSFGTACTYHGLTDQAFAEVGVACRIRRRPRTIRGTRYVFAHASEKRFVGFGDASVWLFNDERVAPRCYTRPS